ncbi:hypothetical protein LOY67_07605 [Pseudomonas sp. B21-056]|uniref:hypothetical protein n=1 Tax=Pseudomonas sp. B21-056 TaxID=2895495 RepID=UPI002231C085|nr:hypothetical protein [Pseudomonas sp. B21-056]UZE25263.1 hypothetical protein LOY67_07605 [Pseudomonas sp. B21-056]
MPEAIGGYFELELRKGQHPYPQAVGFNSARSAFKALLLARKLRRVHLPFYICDVMQDVLHGSGIEVLRYALSEQLELPVFPPLEADEALLFVNYFGLKTDYIGTVLAARYGQRLIVDNSQALFSVPLPGIATLYSPRKFVGVPDGGWLVNGPADLPQAESSRSQARFGALLGRLEDPPQDHYAVFQALEQALENDGIKAMATSTARVLDSIDYQEIARQRMDNFAQLRQRLDHCNRFCSWPAQPVATLCYPLLAKSAETATRLRTQLLEQHIYVPGYWREVLSTATAPTIERDWAECLLPLPIDQRYNVDDMNRLADAILQNTGKS